MKPSKGERTNPYHLNISQVICHSWLNWSTFLQELHQVCMRQEGRHNHVKFQCSEYDRQQHLAFVADFSRQQYPDVLWEIMIVTGIVMRVQVWPSLMHGNWVIFQVTFSNLFFAQPWEYYQFPFLSLTSGVLI